MDSFLYWYSQHNKMIIQALFVCVGLVLIYFVYRVFFVASENQEPAPASARATDAGISNQQIAALDKKLTSLIEMQAAVPAGMTAPSATTANTTATAPDTAVSFAPGTTTAVNGVSGPEAPAAALAEIAQLKKEIQQYTDQLEAKNLELASVKEKIADQQKVILDQATTAFSGSTTTTDLTGDETLTAKVEELQKKLQEYDIISDDIAELQTLRAENADLKSKIDVKASAG